MGINMGGFGFHSHNTFCTRCKTQKEVIQKPESYDVPRRWVTLSCTATYIGTSFLPSKSGAHIRPNIYRSNHDPIMMVGKIVRPVPADKDNVTPDEAAAMEARDLRAISAFMEI